MPSRFHADTKRPTGLCLESLSMNWYAHWNHCTKLRCKPVLRLNTLYGGSQFYVVPNHESTVSRRTGLQSVLRRTHFVTYFQSGDLARKKSRLWIDMERALGSLRMGITAVEISESGATFVDASEAKPCDTEWALSEGFKYVVSGDVYFSDVTFDYDSKKSRRWGTKSCQQRVVTKLTTLNSVRRSLGTL